MGTAQKFVVGMIGLGALYLVVTNSKGFYQSAQAVQRIVGGTETQIITGGKKGA